MSNDIKNTNNNNNTDKKEKKVAVDKRSTTLKLTSIFSVIILIAIVLLFNIIVDGIFGKKLQIDLSASGQNTISQQSQDFLDSLPDGTNIRIVALMDEPDSLSGPQEYVVPLVEDYAAKSGGKVTVEYINPESYPYIIKEIDPLGVYDIGNNVNNYAICYEGKVKIVDIYDCFQYESIYNASVGYNVDTPVNNLAEYTFTNAMSNLVSGTSHKVYIVRDIKASEENTALEGILDNLGMEFDYLDYGDSQFTVPADCELLIMPNIKSDITEVMAVEIDAYLSRAGKVIVSTDYALSISGGSSFTNLNTKVLNLRGINIETYMVMEQDTHYLYNSQNKQETFEFIATTENEDIMNLAQSNNFLVQFPLAVNRVATKYDSSLDVQSFMTTTEKAIRLESKEGTLYQVGSNSAYNIAMYSKGTSTTYDNFELYVFGASTFTSNDHITKFGYNSSNVVLTRNLIKSMFNVTNNYEIASKPLNNYNVDTTKINMSNSSALVVILVAVIPLALIITGTIVYTKRKNL